MMVASLFTVAGLLVVALYCALDAATAEAGRHAADASRHLKARLVAETEAERLREGTCDRCQLHADRTATAEAERDAAEVGRQEWQRRAEALLQESNDTVQRHYTAWNPVDAGTQDEAA